MAVADLLDDDGLLDLRPRGARTDPKAALDELKSRQPALPRSNADLEALAADQAKTSTSPAANAPLPSGQATLPKAPACFKCGNPARSTCRNCQRAACAADSWVMLGLCAECATEDGLRRAHRTGRVDEGNWLEGP